MHEKAHKISFLIINSYTTTTTTRDWCSQSAEAQIRPNLDFPLKCSTPSFRYSKFLYCDLQNFHVRQYV